MIRDNLLRLSMGAGMLLVFAQPTQQVAGVILLMLYCRGMKLPCPVGSVLHARCGAHELGAEMLGVDIRRF